jgi:hypothetical protein
MPTLPFLGGIFNYTAFGVPYFLWIIFGMFLVGLMIGFLFYFFYWVKLTPYHGLLWATLKKFGASFVFDDNMHFDFITDRSSKVIFAETFKQAQEAENDNTETPAATIGKVRADFIFDPDKWTYPNSPQHKVIEDIAEKHNEIHSEDQIRTLVKFSRYLHSGKLDAFGEDLKGLRKTYTVPWARVRMMYKDRDESGSFGFIMSLANTIKGLEQANYNQYALLVLGMFAGLDILYFIAWFIARKPA